MTVDRSHFYDWMDFFRMMAAVLVVICHSRDILMTDYSGQVMYLPFYAATGLGHAGVILFFVLSGFWISRSVLKRIDSPGFWPSYLIDRLSRLEIVLLPAMILGGLVDVFGIFAAQLPIYGGAGGNHSILENVADRLTLAEFAGNLAFLQTIAVKPWGSNGPLWSLANEFWYYVWFPALVLLFRLRRLSWALLSLAVGLVNPGIAWGFISWLVGFALLLLLDRPAKGAALASGTRAALLAVAATAFVGVLGASGLLKGGRLDLLLALAFGWFLFELARAGLRFPKLLLPLASFGSGTSFSLYVIHFPIVALIGGWIVRDGRLPPSLASMALVLALMAFCIVVAWLFSRVTEARTGQLRNWLKARLLPAAQPEAVPR